MDFRIASVQYGDLRGHSAIDGYSGPPLPELAALVDMPDTYFPIGFSIYSGDAARFDGTIFFQVAAVEKKEYGESMQEICESVVDDNIRAKVFSSQIKFEELFKYIKRLHITAINRGLDTCHIEYEEE